MLQNTLRKSRFFLLKLFVVGSVLFVYSQSAQMANSRDFLSSRPEISKTDNLKTQFNLLNFPPVDFWQLKFDKGDSVADLSGLENQLMLGVNDFSSGALSTLDRSNCANCRPSSYPTSQNFLSVGESAVVTTKPSYIRKAFSNNLIDLGLSSRVENLFEDNALTATFPGIGVGAIPDATAAGPQVPGTPLNITFNVTGIGGAPTNVEVNMTGTHSFIGDLKATLIAPNGNSFTVFGYTGATSATSFGSGSQISGTYNFKDSAAGTNWWTAAATTPIPVGNYRTTVSGPTTNPAAVTNLTSAFSGVTNPNGTWTLRLTDGANLDTGTITAANLTISGAPPVAPANDNFVNAFPLLEYPHYNGGFWSGTEGEISGRNTGATIESGEPTHAGVPGGKSVWFKLRAEQFFSTYVFTTNGSDFDTTFAIYTGTNLNNLTLVASNDDLAPFQTSSVAFQAAADTVYYIAIDGKQGASGNFKLAWATKAGPSTFYGSLTDEFYNYYPPEVNLAQATINVDCSTGRYTTTTVAPSNTYFTLPAFPDNALNCRLAGSTNIFPIRLDGNESSRIPFPQTPTYQITGTINAGNAVDTRVIIGGFGKQRDCAVSQITGGGVNYTCSGIGKYSSPTIRVTNPILRYTPSYRDYSNVQSNFSGQNFTTAAATDFDITGRVVNTSGQPVVGLPINVTGTQDYTTNTYSDGLYYASSPNGNYTFTPSNNYNSLPLNYVFNPLNSDQTDKNFTVALKNDSFANAVNITGVSSPILGSVNGATWETGEPYHADQPPRRSIWYRWTAPSNRSFTFSTANSNFDTVIGVYTGSDVGSLSQITANDDVNSNDRTSRATFFATAGTVYSIAIDAKDFYFGEYDRQVTLRVIQNSTISGRIKNVNGRTLNFNVSLDVSCTSVFFNTFNVSGNYSITVPQNSGNCTLTPSGGGVNIWSPSNPTVDSSQDQTGIDFTPQTPSFTVAGILNNLPNTNNVSVSVQLAGSSPRSCSFNTTTGVYQCLSLTIYGDYTVTPSQPGSIFTPLTRDYPSIQGFFTGQDFNAAPTNNPVPTIGSVSPPTATASGAAFSMTVNGSDFINGSVVRWNGQDRQTTFVSATQLTAQITAADIQTAGTFPVMVFNPTPGGGTSATSVPFTVNNPTPAITTLNPTTATVGGSAFELTVNGSNFVNGSIVKWGGQNRTTTFVSATQVKAQITAADIQTAGTFPITVFNTTPGGGTSNAVNFTVNNPVPAVTTLSPTNQTVGAAAFELTVNGTGFINGSIVRWNGQNRTTTFVSAIQVKAQITAADVQTAGTFPIIVFNPTPGGGTSNSVNFIVNNPVPTITTMSPTNQLIGAGAFELTVNGSNFVNGSVIKWNGQTRPTTFVSASQVKAQIPATDSQTLGTFPITVFNAAPGGGTSNAINFMINNPRPAITTLSPSGQTAGSPAFELTVNGSSFLTGSIVQWNGQNRTTNFVSATQVKAQITAADVQTAGTFPITVTNPAPGGGASNAVNFTVSNSSISVTVQTNPAGLSIIVDGVTYTSPPPFSWVSGSSHTISCAATQNGTTGTRYAWNSWGDGNTQNPRTIAPTAATTYTANYTTQYQLTVNASPANGGTITPTSGNWYNAGQQVQATATSNGGFRFDNWTGAYTGTNNPATLTLNGPVTETANFSVVTTTRHPLFDFDGDNKTDIGIFRPSDGNWWYSRSSDNGVRVYTFGNASDIMTPGDFTGDGKADIAIWRPSTGFWFVQRSEDSSFYSFPFGSNGDIPAPADYDGDGKTDAAVFRPASGTWFILNSGGSGVTIVNFGTAQDKPVPADFDGDGKADIAIFRPGDGTWWYLQSSDFSSRVYRFGVGTDKPVPGDYTGDGKADIAVFRPSTGEWLIQRSEDTSFYSVPFGANGDIPVPGDYDGDGKNDTAVFRPNGATWFINRSTAGILIAGFGVPTDVPIPSAYVR